MWGLSNVNPPVTSGGATLSRKLPHHENCVEAELLHGSEIIIIHEEVSGLQQRLQLGADLLLCQSWAIKTYTSPLPNVSTLGGS